MWRGGRRVVCRVADSGAADAEVSCGNCGAREQGDDVVVHGEAFIAGGVLCIHGWLQELDKECTQGSWE
jgi:hypothetical protein